METGLTVGVVSSHGHEMGHVTVWDTLPEVKDIHVCSRLSVKFVINHQDHLFSRSVLTTFPVGHLPL